MNVKSSSIQYLMQTHNAETNMAFRSCFYNETPETRGLRF